MGAVMMSRQATIHQLQTDLSLQDAYDVLEVVGVEAHNQRIINKRDD